MGCSRLCFNNEAVFGVFGVQPLSLTTVPVPVIENGPWNWYRSNLTRTHNTLMYFAHSAKDTKRVGTISAHYSVFEESGKYAFRSSIWKQFYLPSCDTGFREQLMQLPVVQCVAQCMGRTALQRYLSVGHFVECSTCATLDFDHHHYKCGLVIINHYQSSVIFNDLS